MTTAPSISLDDLQAYDPQARDTERERRFLCMFCGDGKPRDDAHRCFCVNTETGAWNCKRCHQTGKLSDFWTDRPPSNRRDRARLDFQRKMELPPAPTPPPLDNKWRAQLKSLAVLQSTLGADYLSGRGIPCQIAHDAGARFSNDFYGRPAVVFPIRDRAGALVAASGRYIDGRDTPKTRIAGPKRDGVFVAPVQVQSTLHGTTRIFSPFDKDAPAIIVTEAPLDALSIATAGYPAIALCGISGPSWLPIACGFRRVLLAFDADEAGDRAAVASSGDLASVGASCERLRPDGIKDWNEVLCTSGAAALSDWLAPRVLLDMTARTEVESLEDETLFDE